MSLAENSPANPRGLIWSAYPAFNRKGEFRRTNFFAFLYTINISLSFLALNFRKAPATSGTMRFSN
jgi:hypothetical protein